MADPDKIVPGSELADILF